MPFWSSSKKTQIKKNGPLIKITFGAGCFQKLELEHYTTIAYVPEKERWYNFNDEKVHPIDRPHWKNLAGDPNNVPLLFFYTLKDQKISKKRKWSTYP